jgi:hypothetical protein
MQERVLYRARICKRLRRPGIDSEDSIPPAYVALRAGTKNRVVVQARQAENRFLGSLKCLQIRAQYCEICGLGLERLYTLHSPLCFISQTMKKPFSACQ